MIFFSFLFFLVLTFFFSGTFPMLYSTSGFCCVKLAKARRAWISDQSPYTVCCYIQLGCCYRCSTDVYNMLITHAIHTHAALPVGLQMFFLFFISVRRFMILIQRSGIEGHWSVSLYVDLYSKNSCAVQGWGFTHKRGPSPVKIITPTAYFHSSDQCVRHRK